MISELKEKLMQELEYISKKTQLTASDLQLIDMLAHSIKNLCNVEENEYSGGNWRAEGYSNARHYVRGHYSRDNERSYRDMLESEYANSRDERERENLRRMIDRI